MQGRDAKLISECAAVAVLSIMASAIELLVATVKIATQLVEFTRGVFAKFGVFEFFGCVKMHFLHSFTFLIF